MSLSKKNKTFLIVFISISIVGYGAYQYVYQKHDSIERLTPTYQGNSEIFKNNVETNAAKWQGKIVEITGNVTAKDASGILLAETIYCQFKEVTKTRINTTITIKGRVIGYDDLLEEIKLDQCIIIQH